MCNVIPATAAAQTTQAMQSALCSTPANTTDGVATRRRRLFVLPSGAEISQNVLVVSGLYSKRNS